MVGGAEGFGVLPLEDCEARGGRARLEDGDDSPARVLVAQRSQRLADGGRVVREVVNDRDAALAPAHLHAPLDALERGERVLDLRARDAPRFGGDDDREAVAHVEVADERHLELTPLRAVAEDPEARHLARSVINVARLPARVVARAEGFKLRVKPVAHLPDDLADGCAVPARDEATVRGDEVHQAAEGELDRVEVRVDVRVVELDVADDGDFGQVVHELRPLVEVGRVVLVALDDEVVAVRHSKTRPEVLHDAADEETGVQAAPLQHPRRDARRGGLAVRARDDERAAAPDELLLDDLGLRAIDEPPVQSLLDLGVPARECVADDDAVGRRA